MNDTYAVFWVQYLMGKKKKKKTCFICKGCKYILCYGIYHEIHQNHTIYYRILRQKNNGKNVSLEFEY